jgi:putative ABC transport system permease protein
MSIWRQLTRGLRTLTRRGETDAELNDEVHDYLDRATDANIARGMSLSAAYRAARIELGNSTVTQERVRNSGWERGVETLIADVRYGLRRLRSNPGFTAVSAITLALGVGATTVIFSAINPILFKALPYPSPDRVLMVSDAGNNGTPMPVAFGTYREILLRNHSFDALAPFKAWQPALGATGEPERLVGQAVGAQYFRALGVAPARGRDFTADDDRNAGPRVAILSNALWQRRFGGDLDIVGRTVTLDDDPYVVIGVMPASFENVPDAHVDIWRPLQYKTVFTPDMREWGHHLRLVGRARAGVDLEAARADLNAIARTPRPDMPRVPWASLETGIIVTSLQADVAREVRPALLAVFAAVLVLLVIACVNVTNLLLARGAQRRGEFALRAALGAERGRLVRQLITESMILSLFGGVLGMIVAVVGLRAFISLSPVTLPRLGSMHIDGMALGFAVLVTSVIGLTVGVLPAIHASREDLQAGLQETSRRSVSEHHVTRRVLVVAEVALSLVLLVSAGLLLRSLERVFAVNVGFDSSQMVTMQVQLTGHRYDPDVARARFLDEALGAVRRVPGVSMAAFTQQLPLSGDLDVYGVHLEANTDPKDDGAALRYAVTPDYFAAMRIPLIRGRFLDSHDVAGAPRAVVINEAFARAEFGKNDPIGQRMRIGPTEGDGFTIVGIVGDVKQEIDALDSRYAVYTTPSQWHWVDELVSLVVRSTQPGNPASLAAPLRNAIWSVDREQPIVRVATMSALETTATGGRRFALILFELFGAVALLLAAVGIYGVLSGSVTERIREIGVRSAMGAAPRDILALILGQGMKLTTVGAALGLIGAFAATRGLVTMLFGVTHLDPPTYVGVIVLLFAVSAIACWMPAWRAARVDPSITLRSE